MPKKSAGQTPTGLCALAALLVTALGALPAFAGRVEASPPPETQFDVPKLERAMHDCISYAIPAEQVLAGWVNARTGETLQWRCNSLRHMYLEQTNVHDPFVNVAAFIHCTDRIISYGPPHPATNPKYKALIYQYNGTSRRGYVIYNPANRDIVTIYTDPDDDWVGCSNGR